eukprot:2223967-Alexandrium_andersonii.AAC.1
MCACVRVRVRECVCELAGMSTGTWTRKRAAAQARGHKRACADTLGQASARARWHAGERAHA